MSKLDYPLPLEGPFGPFPKIAVRARPKPSSSSPLKTVITTVSSDGPSLRLSSFDQVRTTGPSRLVLTSDDGAWSSSSYTDGDEVRGGKAKPTCFCPGVDAARLGWKVHNPGEAASATLEVFAARLDGAVARKTLSASDLTQDPVSGAGCSGSISVDDLDWSSQHKELFLDKVFTVEHSPYQARLTVQAKGSSACSLFPSTAWTFFHVVVDQVVVVAGDPAQIPPRPEDEGAAASLAEEVAGWEEELVGKLQSEEIKAEVIELALQCQMVAGVPPAESDDLDRDCTSSRDKGSHHALTATWGKGPRIPLKAKVLLRTAAGSAASLKQSGPGLGRAWFLWDWRDDPDKWKQWLEEGETGNTLLSQKYLEAQVTPAVDGQPLGSTNCPKEFGGKRGDDQWPVFPAQEEGKELGYEVTAAGSKRPWAALSRGGAGKRKGTTGVIFQPSCILGDQYRVRVWLTSPPKDAEKDDKPLLVRPDVALNESTPKPLGEVIGGATSPPPGDATGAFQIFRRSKLTVAHLVKERDQALIEETAKYYKKALGYVLDWEEDNFESDYLEEDGQQGTNWEDLQRDLGGGQVHIRDCGVIAWGIEGLADLAADGTLCKSKSWDDYQALIRSHLVQGRGYAVAATQRRVCQCHAGTVSNHTLCILTRAGGKDLCVTDQAVEHDDYLRLAFRTHQILRAEPPQGLSSHNVEVVFEAGGERRSYPIKYPKVGLRQLRSRTLPDDDLTGLEQELDALAGAVDDFHPLTIRYKARNNNSRNRVRCERLATALTEMLAARYHPLDMTMGQLMQTYLEEHYNIFGQVMSPILYYSQIFKALKDALARQLQDARFLGLTPQRKTASFVEDDEPGIHYVIWGPACSHTTGNDGAYSNNACDCFHGFIQHHRAGETLVFKQLGSTERSIMIHELGHAFWRPHAVSALFAARSPTNAVKDHLVHDTCVMNYDPEPSADKLCGQCILEGRGWLVQEGSHSLTDAKGWLETEIEACDDDGVKAWKQMRRARLANAQGDARAWIEASVLSAAGLDEANRVSLLREAIIGFKKNGGQLRAEALWADLKDLSEIQWDRCDTTGAPYFDD